MTCDFTGFIRCKGIMAILSTKTVDWLDKIIEQSLSQRGCRVMFVGPLDDGKKAVDAE